MPLPPEAPMDPASDATTRISDILASAEREVAGIVAAAERRSAEEHDERSSALDARSAELDERDAALDARSTELDEGHAALAARAAAVDVRAAELDVRASAVDRRAAELTEITSGLLESSLLEVQRHAQRLADLPPLGVEGDGAPSLGTGAGAGASEPVAPPRSIRRRAFGPVPVSSPPEAARPVGLRSVGPVEIAGPGPGPDDDRPRAAEDTGHVRIAEPARDEEPARDDEPRRAPEAVRAVEPADEGLLHDGEPPAGDEPVHHEGPIGDVRRVEDDRPAGDPADPTAGDATPDDRSADAPDPGRVDSPDKIDSARLVALSMAAEGRPRDDVEAYIRDELQIVDHASLIDYVFGISTPSSVVPSWPPRRRRRS